MTDFNYNTRREITEKRKAGLCRRIQKSAGKDSKLLAEVYGGYKVDDDQTAPVIRQFYQEPEKNIWMVSAFPQRLAGCICPGKIHAQSEERKG